MDPDVEELTPFPPLGPAVRIKRSQSLLCAALRHLFSFHNRWYLHHLLE
jgi:hypothetical protein